MSRLDLGDKEILPITIFGQEIDLDMPTMKDIVKMQTSIEQAKEDKTEVSYTAVRDLVIKMGMPADVAEQMQVGHFEKLVTHLLTSKKK